MAARNAIKQYIENGYYHVYNRGVEKRLIFQDEQDYGVFLSYLKEYLSPKDELALNQKLSDPNTPYSEKDKILKSLRMNNFYGEITLLAYCLMPNHFHFFIKQKEAMSIDKFMQSLCTRYTMYFNRKYKRVGSLFQAVYKAVSIESETQFLYISKYIHQQALATQVATQALTLHAWEGKQPCSFSEYMGLRKTGWVETHEVLDFFSKNNPALSYKNFIIEQDDYEIIQNLILDE